MSFVYFQRKQEDIDLFKKLQHDKRELVSEFNDKRSSYDVDLEKYNLLLRKLDKLRVGSDEHKACVSELEGLVNKLKSVEKKEDSTKSNEPIVEKVVKAKAKRQPIKKQPVSVLTD
jgi:hypothetical protein